MRESKTDWDRLANMTEEEIEANTLSDPDNSPLTEEELVRMRLLPIPKRIRERLGLSHFEFAIALELSVETVQDWEDSFPWISYPVQTLLHLIEQDPKGVKAALEKSYQQASWRSLTSRRVEPASTDSDMKHRLPALAAGLA